LYEWRTTMFRLGVISDLHADLTLLDAGLALMSRLGCDRVVCAGDLVDGGTLADETLARLRDEGIATIRGNHDRCALQRGGALMPGSLPARLSDASMRFLDGLPLSWELEVEGTRVVMWHASPGDDMKGIEADEVTEAQLAGWLDETRADVLLVGHTHHHFALRVGDRLVANPGALWSGAYKGQRMAGGKLGVLELPSRRFRVYEIASGQIVSDSGAA
jgi:putative phosphoesterase